MEATERDPMQPYDWAEDSEIEFDFMLSSWAETLADIQALPEVDE